MKKVLIVASVASMIDQFNMPNIELLQSIGYEVHVACNFEKGSTCSSDRIEQLKQRFIEMKVRYYQIDFSRSVTALGEHIRAYKQLEIIIKKNQYEFVHCHTPIAGVVGRVAAHQNKLKVIYTAHGFHFFDGAPLKNWLVYYPIEKFFSRWTDVLITINKEDYERAKKKFHAKKVEYIPGVGVDIEKFAESQVDVKGKRQELGIEEDAIMLLSVGELSDRKNHEVVIKALKDIGNKNIHYFICGQGEKREYLTRLMEESGLAEQVHLLGYRTDISALCQTADLFVFPSKQEGLPVALMEAVACHVPVICSNIRGNTDLIKNEKDLFDPFDVQSLTVCLREKIGNESRMFLKERMQSSVDENYSLLMDYDLSEVIEKNEQTYGEIGGVIRLYRKQQFKESMGIDKEAFILLSVGELSERKNQIVVIEALKELSNLNIVYLLVGEGYLRESFANKIEQYGLENKIQLLGYRNDVVELCKIADCFVHPSIREGLGIAPLEAMASGLPLISSYVNGIKDYTEDGKSGCCVSPRSIPEMIEAIRKMYSDKAFRKCCRNSNLNTVKRFAQNHSDEITRKIYLEM